MTVTELIERLRACPDPDAQVAFQSAYGTEPEGLLDVEAYPKDHNFPFVFVMGS